MTRIIANKSRAITQRTQWLVAIANDRVMELYRSEFVVSPKPPSLLCSSCGGILVCQEIWLPGGLRLRIRPLWQVAAIPRCR
ncbi:MAG: hypothetical protein O2856_15205 [Planctomycetota bacterium]|nr:hypothetical protein [Planctomycetota bacterium]